MEDAKLNTDRELWRGLDNDRVFVTEGGGIGIDVAGTVVVKTPRMWLAIGMLDDLETRINTVAASVAAMRRKDA
jgi:hypothetical protein